MYQPFTRLLLNTMSTLFALLAAIFVRGVQAGPLRPNIVLVLADDLGWYDVGFHGSEVRTPHIDWLAREGVRLENYYTQPMCGPSRLQLLSGKYQIRYGLQHRNLPRDHPSGLPLEIPTMAEQLRATGYITHMVGKWHIGFHTKAHLPTNRGFDSFYGMLCGSGDYYNHTRDWEATPYRDLRRNEEVDWSEESDIHSGYLYTQEAQTIISNHSKNPETPFFLYLAHQLVHGPNQVPDRYEDLYASITDSARRAHAAQTSFLDDAIANLTDTLQLAGLWENTVFIFSTDNGGQQSLGGYNTPLRGNKEELWEGGIRGTAFVHSPLLAPWRRGAVVRDLLHITDWFPTFLSLAEGKTDFHGLDGFNIWPSISEGTPGRRSELLHNIDPMWKTVGERYMDGLFDNRIRAAIRVNQWKLLTGNPGKGYWYDPERPGKPERPHEATGKNLWLFNIDADPEERYDVAADNPDVVNELLKKLSFYNASAAPCWYPQYDERSNPALLGNAWGPWL